ncbi:hypothetical protein AAMO2058_001501800 [Amorphochlora amoebiformis]
MTKPQEIEHLEDIRQKERHGHSHGIVDEEKLHLEAQLMVHLNEQDSKLEVCEKEIHDLLATKKQLTSDIEIWREGSERGMLGESGVGRERGFGRSVRSWKYP